MSKLLVENVGKVFPAQGGGEPTRALMPTSLTVADNDFITILGPSGCGKSTLLRIIGGLETASEGRVLLDGSAVSGPGADRGFVFQSYTLFPWLTVQQNVEFGLKAKGMGRAERAEIARALHRAGAKVALSGTRVEPLQALADELGGNAFVLPCNLSDPAAVELEDQTVFGVHADAVARSTGGHNPKAALNWAQATINRRV